MAYAVYEPSVFCVYTWQIFDAFIVLKAMNLTLKPVESWCFCNSSGKIYGYDNLISVDGIIWLLLKFRTRHRQHYKSGSGNIWLFLKRRRRKCVYFLCKSGIFSRMRWYRSLTQWISRDPIFRSRDPKRVPKTPLKNPGLRYLKLS